jgi:DNA-directed RNA polymerase
MPNFVHSLDAANVVKLCVDNQIVCRKVDLLTIHDCFGAHINHISLVKEKVREGFMYIYTDDKVLEDFNQKCLDTLSLFNLPEAPYVYSKEKGVVKLDKKLIKIPILPSMGTLDLKQIKNAQFLVSQ